MGGRLLLTEKEFQVRLPADLHEALKRRSEADDRSMAQIIRHALRGYLERDLTA